MKDIYALCDFSTLQKKAYSLEQFIQKTAHLPIKIIQYRDKINSKVIQKKNLLTLKKLTNIPVIINDNIDLVEFCDGLHLGQEDIEKIHKNKELAVKLVRSKIKRKLFGISTHNEIEILETNNLDLDYIGLGAYRNTSTKDVDNIIYDKAEYLAKLSIHPVGIIGGVRKDDVIQNVTYNVIGSDLYDD